MNRNRAAVGDPADRRHRRQGPGKISGEVIVCDDEAEMVREADRTPPSMCR